MIYIYPEMFGEVLVQNALKPNEHHWFEWAIRGNCYVWNTNVTIELRIYVTKIITEPHTSLETCITQGLQENISNVDSEWLAAVSKMGPVAILHLITDGGHFSYNIDHKMI